MQCLEIHELLVEQQQKGASGTKKPGVTDA